MRKNLFFCLFISFIVAILAFFSVSTMLPSSEEVLRLNLETSAVASGFVFALVFVFLIVRDTQERHRAEDKLLETEEEQ